jgi:beta-glucanase (GH16 family)
MGAALVPTIPGARGRDGGQLYGRYVIRFRTDPVPGYKMVILLWPDSGNWPTDGEIDFPEANLNSNIWGHVHHQGGTSGNDQTGFRTSVMYARGWHTAAINWLPGKVILQLDGRTIGTTTTRVPNTRMHLVIQAETSTDGSVPTPSAAGNFQIDWLVVYRRT